ncbi:protein ALP1-like [Leptopilina heterotoma]|uniref:protein ALP1-like n=1 Tax=Leptopilina heterotoma TaxID=63436 RepID=UPI001CA95B9D|nr:protein ALP1-like [Leptopilina heterotoma]
MKYCFLAHGDSVSTLSKMYFIGLSTLYEIISEVCEQVWNILSPIYLPERQIADWIEIGERYENRWHFPNCLGALDGKHIRISKPPRSGSAFFNYKKYYSFVLMAICDPEYRFTWIDIGDYGSLNDASVFNASGFGQELEAGRYPLPEGKPLSGMNEQIPYFFIGNEAFGLRSYLMRPYSKRYLKYDDQKLFNYRLSHARTIIEDTFGILVTVWRILQTTLSFKLRTSILIVKCLLCLHNFLLSKESQEPEENRKYATEKLMQKIRENYKSNKSSNEDFGRKEDVEDVDDDDDEEYVVGGNDDDDNDKGNRQERIKIPRKVCSESQKIRNILCAYFAKQNNLM